MCSEHASKIDKNKGADYKAEVLQQWKAIHEHQIAQEHLNVFHPYGWIENIEIKSCPIFENNQKIDFQKLNLITGNNSTGKTAICEWLISLSDLGRLTRWGSAITGIPKPEKELFKPLKFNINYWAPNKQNLKIELKNGNTAVKINNNTTPFPSIKYNVIYLSFENNIENTNHRFQKKLGIDLVKLANITKHLNKENGIFYRNGRWSQSEDDDNTFNLTCKFLEGPQRSFGLMSSSEQFFIMLDFMIARASIESKQSPTLLIIELEGLTFSPQRYRKIFEHLSAPSTPFQTLITAYSDDTFDEFALWHRTDIIKSENYSSQNPVYRLEKRSQSHL
ncbi:hypothetical protein TH9_18790 [Thalassospira xiamenensis]|nr:hypothetical protein TH9_18790 [Thalassospira xiamenensis]